MTVNVNLAVLKVEHHVNWSVDTHVPYTWCFNPLNISMHLMLKRAAALNLEMPPVLVTTKIRNYVPFVD